VAGKGSGQGDLMRRKNAIDYEIVNVVATMKMPHLDLYKIAQYNKDVDFDEESLVARFPTACGIGKVTIAKGYIGVIGMKSVKQARDELRKVPDRLKLFFVDRV
jgi:TATA-box binding protein (TBP) (component of TFIID and TFIIIB)